MDLVSAALSNPINRAILQRLPLLGVAQPYLVAGCLFQSFWNVKSDRPVRDGIKDYDIFYFDGADLSYEAEDAVVRRAGMLFADLDVLIDIKNQARVHLWFKQRFGQDYPQLHATTDGIARFQVRGTCLGVTPNGDGSIGLHATYGVEDISAGILRRNPLCPDGERYLVKAESYRARWPWLTIVEDEAA
jgi:hypothetical protein